MFSSSQQQPLRISTVVSESDHLLTLFIAGVVEVMMWLAVYGTFTYEDGEFCEPTMPFVACPPGFRPIEERATAANVVNQAAWLTVCRRANAIPTGLINPTGHHKRHAMFLAGVCPHMFVATSSDRANPYTMPLFRNLLSHFVSGVLLQCIRAVRRGESACTFSSFAGQMYRSFKDFSQPVIRLVPRILMRWNYLSFASLRTSCAPKLTSYTLKPFVLFKKNSGLHQISNGTWW